MILACIVLTVTNVAAFWAWRLAENSLTNEQSKSSMLSLGHSAIKRERDELQARINNAMERCNKIEKGRIADNNMFQEDIAKLQDELNLMKINRVNENNMHDAEVKELRTRFDLDLTKLHQSRDEITRRLSRLNDINIGLQNEIDGLNVDKLHLKSELAKYRAIHEKRKAQKAANMRRFRAKQKEAKG
jgi:hypothetical protein